VTKRRSPDFDLAAAIRAPGFTAREGDLPALVALLAGEDDAGAAAAERALVDLAPRLGAGMLAALDAQLAAAGHPLRGRLVRVYARLGLGERLLALVDDPDPKASRNAIIALGKLPGAASEQRLLALLAAPGDPARLRSAVAALGKIGAQDALAALRALDPRGDAELVRLRAQALLRVERTLARDVASRIDLDAALDRDAALVLTCRTGLETLLAEELAALDGRFAPRPAPGLVAATLPRGLPLAGLYRARLFIAPAFELPMAGDPAQALGSPAALAILARLTRGPIRYRLSFAGAGHRRAEVLRIARAVAALRPELANDPTATTWDVEVPARPAGRLRLWPRRLDDPRWSYRRRDVPAASHPTVAAALARVAGAHPDDVVWDPFVGSGAELVERALLGPYRALWGGDLDPAALDAARENLAAAGHAATLERRDARVGPPPGTTLVISNPPMGQRVLSRAAVGPLLVQLVDAVAATLPAGGRLAWLSPVPRDTADRARQSGLAVRRRLPVDLGGVQTELQLFVK
jgi:hypothetical protein